MESQIIIAKEKRHHTIYFVETYNKLNDDVHGKYVYVNSLNGSLEPMSRGLFPKKEYIFIKTKLKTLPK